MIARRQVLATFAGIAVAGPLVACSSGSSSGSTDPNAPVKISIGDRPTPDNAAALKQYNDTVAAFMKANPNITIDTSETVWDPQTFQAQVAGGTLPTVLSVAFTEPALLMANRQLPDITDQLKSMGLLDQLNPAVLPTVSRDNRIYAVPIFVYTFALIYNRKLFTAAGLDPDKPPTTWDEVRAAAKAITQKTGKTGFGAMTTKNQGGWGFTNMVYGMGGRIESGDGKKSRLTDEPVVKTLQLLKDMRWTDNSLGSQFLYDANGVTQDFAAGKVGMMLHLPAVWSDLVKKFGMKAADVGVGQSPQAGTDLKGVLTGGNVRIISIKASSEQVNAALKWIAYNDFRPFSDKAVAVANVKATLANKDFVGIPGVTPLGEKQYDQYLEWIKPSVNVPAAGFTGYTDTVKKMPLIAEPPNKAQEAYKALDTVVQKVMTDQSVDPAALLSDAAKSLDSKLSR